MFVRTPNHRLHKASGQSFVQLNGRRIHLEKYGTPESKQRYRHAIVE